MDIQLTMERIQNARRAMVRAQNPGFRKLWDEVATKLFEDMVVAEVGQRYRDAGQPWLRTYDGKLQ